MDVTYVRTREGYKVDFLAHRAGKAAMLIQVCAELDDAETREREVRALFAAAAEHPGAGLHLITLTPESASEIPDPVVVHPAAAWFLGLEVTGLRSGKT